MEYTIDSGREILTVTPQIKQDEDRIAMETRISKLHRSNKSVERTQVRPTSGNVVNTQQSQTSTTSTTSNQTSPTRSTTRTTTTRSSSSSSPSGGGGGMRSTSGGY